MLIKIILTRALCKRFKNESLFETRLGDLQLRKVHFHVAVRGAKKTTVNHGKRSLKLNESYKRLDAF